MSTENLLKLVSDDFIHKRAFSVKYVFVSVDTAAGGDRSGYAVMSCFYTDEGQAVIIGAEYGHPKDFKQVKAMLVPHLQKIREMPEFGSATFILIPESNLGFEGSNLADFLIHHTRFPVISVNEDSDRPGIKNDADTKRALANALGLMIHSDRVQFYCNFFTTSYGFTNKTMKDEIYKQLANFCCIIRPSENIYKPPTIYFSGKEGYGYDDLVIALQLNIGLSRFFLTSPKYRGFLKR